MPGDNTWHQQLAVSVLSALYVQVACWKAARAKQTCPVLNEAMLEFLVIWLSDLCLRYKHGLRCERAEECARANVAGRDSQDARHRMFGQLRNLPRCAINNPSG